MDEVDWAGLLEGPDLQSGVANDSDEILPGLHLGNSTAARGARSLGFGAVLNCADEDPARGCIDGVSVFDLEALGEIRYKGLAMKDGAMGPPVTPWLHEGADWIADCFESAAVSKLLVHCAAGKSRSASVLIAYLVKHRKFSLLEAITTVRRARHRAYPRLHFWEALRDFEIAARGGESSVPLDALAHHDERREKDGSESAKLSELVAMGFGEACALEVLQKCGFDLNVAINVLLADTA